MRAIVFNGITGARRFVAFVDRLLGLPKPGTDSWCVPIVHPTDGRAAVPFKGRKLDRFIGMSRTINGITYTLRAEDIVDLDASWFRVVPDPDPPTYPENPPPGDGPP